MENKREEWSLWVKALKHSKKMHPRYGISWYVILFGGIKKVVKDCGGYEGFRSLLLDAGYAREYTYRVIKNIKEDIKFNEDLNEKYKRMKNIKDLKKEHLKVRCEAHLRNAVLSRAKDLNVRPSEFIRFALEKAIENY